MADKEQNGNEKSLVETLFTRRNMMTLGFIVVAFVVTAVLANQTVNAALREETARDVPDDVSDVGDKVFDVLEPLQEGLNSALSDLDGTPDENAFSTAISESMDDVEDVAPFTDTIGLYHPDADPIVLTYAETTVTDEDGDEDTQWVVEARAEEAANEALSAFNPDEVTFSEGEGFWRVDEDAVRYFTPLATGEEGEDAATAFAWASVTRESLQNLMAEGAAGEDLLVDTETGYVLMVTADNEVVANYNSPSTPPEQISQLRNRLNENTEVSFDDESYYNVANDPIMDGATSFATSSASPINDWAVLGAIPTSEIPSQTLAESTVNLFDVSEVGDTFSLAIANVTRFLNEDVGWLFRGMRAPIEAVITTIEDGLLAVHWSVVILAMGAVALATGGRQVAMITLIGMFAIGMLGLWDKTMTTLAMLITSMAFCVLVGIPLGIWAARNDNVNQIMRAVLDAMQTIHPFVYLVPIAILFGIGKVPGTIATIIFALPPMVRLTTLGIRQVPSDVVEAARAFGSNDWQLLIDVQIPLAIPSIMAGVNQTLMLSLSMVVIVALIAGGGLGQEIYGAIQNANIGRAFVAGTAVLLLAVVIDRISQGGGTSKSSPV